MQDRRLFVIGHSHSRCLVAAKAEGVSFEVLNLWAMPPGTLNVVNGKRTLDAGASQRLIPPVITMMGGGAHSVLSVGRHPRPFDFVLPDAPDLPLDPAVEILPYDAVRRRLEAEANDYLDMTAMIGDLVRGPVFHVDTPPPVASAEFMAPHMPWAYYPDRLQEISPASHRYRMWRLNTDITKAHCRRIGIGFIAHPSDVEDAEGYLDPRFSDDGIHGNDLYGERLAHRIVSVVRDGRLSPMDVAPVAGASVAYRTASRAAEGAL